MFEGFISEAIPVLRRRHASLGRPHPHECQPQAKVYSSMFMHACIVLSLELGGLLGVDGRTVNHCSGKVFFLLENINSISFSPFTQITSML